jgi:hypothetical protein
MLYIFRGGSRGTMEAQVLWWGGGAGGPEGRGAGGPGGRGAGGPEGRGAGRYSR